MTGNSPQGGHEVNPAQAVHSESGSAPWERARSQGHQRQPRSYHQQPYQQPPGFPAPPRPEYQPVFQQGPYQQSPNQQQSPSRAQPTPVQPGPGPRPDADAPRPAQRSSGLLAATGSIALATLISRITGFVKQLLILTVLGASVASSFTVASLIPNMIAELVLGAVLTAIVVPVLVRAEREDPDQGAAFVRRLFTAAVTLLVVAALLATAAAPVLTTHVFLEEDGMVSTALTTALSYLLLPAILFYGLSALLTAILNTRQVFKPGAWAPVLNNLVVLTVLVIYLITPGEISLDPVRMSDPKLLTLGIGVTLGVVTQAFSLVPAIRREGISLKPLWGLDDRLRQFAGMAVAIVLYVLISQAGMIFATRISSYVDAAGPAIYQNAWLLLQLPYGVLGVTVLTAIMPRLSRNAAADDTPAVVDDLSVATRLTMIALIPIITFLTFTGPQVGEALYGYGNFGAGDAGRLGQAVSWSAFTLIPYSLVLIHLRVFYAREQAWTPTWIILGITTVKIALSALAPVVATSNDQVVILLGVANGLAFTVGAVIGGFLLHRTLGDLHLANVGRTVWKVLLASGAGALAMFAADRLLNLAVLTEAFGGLGSMARIGVLGILMLTVTLTILWLAKVPEILAITTAVTRKVNRVRGRGPDAEPGEEAGAASQPIPTYIPPYDAVTDLIPVVRDDPGYVEGPRGLPYPVQQPIRPGWNGPRSGVRPDGRGSELVGEGVRVSDDDVAGTRNGKSTVHEPEPGVVSTNVENRDAAASSATPASAGGTPSGTGAVNPEAIPGLGRQTPPRDPHVDTGVIPIGSPQLPPLRIGGTDATPSPPLRGPKLIPGASVAGGRYRLLAPHGGARGLKFWEALDVKLDRPVALTFVDSEQRAATAGGPEGPQAILSRTLRLGRINSPGLARVLDVVRGSSGGIVVSEWTPGRSLREMAATEPSAIGAAGAISTLAAAAEIAHRGGSSLSIDHPDRVRISVAGDAVLAFPGTLADADPTSDVRGLGAMLYALITARWPLAEPAGTVGGLKLADRGADGRPVEPRIVRPDVPFEISAVAVRALETDAGIRTAATVQHLLDQAAVADLKTELMPALRLGQRGPGKGHALADPEALAAEKKHSERMIIALVALGITTVVILALIGWWIANLLAGGSSDAPLNKQNFGLTTTAQAPAESPRETSAAEPAPPALTPVLPAGVRVFSPQGTPDGVRTAGQAIDGDPATSWSTDAYFQPFPSLKNGVGLMVTLREPAKLANVWINSPSAGTRVEIRSAPSADASLDQTQIIGAQQLSAGVTEIPVRTQVPTSNVLVWITGLGTAGGLNQSSIAEIGFNATR